MKAERRHELKDNSLAATLFNLPEIGKKYGSRIALGIILLGLIVFWVRYRMSTNEEHLDKARHSLADAKLDLQRLKNLASGQPGQESAVAQQRQIWYADALTDADNAIASAGNQDLQLKAQALICKGDANFNLANLPDLPGAATQPSLQTQPDKTELLGEAEEAYKQVLLDFPQQHFESMAAHFGLAAIAENRAALGIDPSTDQWNEAHLQYQAILDDDSVTPPFKDYALYRQQLIPQLQQPALIGVSPTAVTRPTLGPTYLLPPTTQSAIK
jgi:hypothetical protein